MSIRDEIASFKQQKQEASAPQISPDILAMKKKKAEMSQPFDKPVWDPEAPISYEGEGALPLAVAGFGKGGADVYKNVSNMLGFDSAPTIFAGEGEYGLGLGMTDTTDEGLLDLEKEYEGITDTTAGAVGEFVGEAAALAPLGAVGTGVRTVGAGMKMLPTAAKVLAATSEGALAGSILADPNNRVGGAVAGGLSGGALTGLFAGGSRLVKDGLAKVSPEAQALKKTIKKFTGKDADIPLLQAYDPKGGGITSVTEAIMEGAGHLPAAGNKFKNQADDLMMDVYRTNLNQAFHKPVQLKAALKALNETGDMRKAIERGKDAGVKRSQAAYTSGQQVLEEASRGQSRGKYTGEVLRKAAEKSGREAGADYADASFREIGDIVERTVDRSLDTSTVASRSLFHKAVNLIGAAVTIFPGAGAVLGSPRTQNFLMGSTKWQQKLQRAVASKDGQRVRRIVSDIRRAASAQPANSDNPQGLANQAVDATTGFFGAN